jgi:3-hydroxyisobutyrate dehydrogenase
MLPNGEAVRSVYLDESSGVIAGVKLAAATSPVRKLIVECGTIESATILDVAKAAEEAERSLPQGSVLDFVDAPVSGGPNGAANGTLAFMVGTNRPDTVFERVKSMLVHMGNSNSIFLCGNTGAGTAFKVINNYISAIASLASSEALNIGVKLGLDPKRLTDVINASGGQTWITSNINPVPGVQQNVPSSRNYEGGFRIELCTKVLEMGSELAKQANARTVLDKPTIQAFKEAAADERYKGKDARVVYKWLNEST